VTLASASFAVVIDKSATVPTDTKSPTPFKNKVALVAGLPPVGKFNFVVAMFAPENMSLSFILFAKSNYGYPITSTFPFPINAGVKTPFMS
jgi:hypothetical protein